MVKAWREGRRLLVAALALAMAIALLLVAVHLHDFNPNSLSSRVQIPRRIVRQVSEGLQVRMHGVYGVDIVRCASVRVEKRKLGPLAIGALNELVMDDLHVVLPMVGERQAVPGEHYPTGSPQAVLDSLGVTKDSLSASVGGLPKFSGVRINGLTVGRLDVATNVVLRLTARLAESRRGGLRLRGCEVFDGATTNRLSEALLAMAKDNRLTLVWPSGEINL